MSDFEPRNNLILVRHGESTHDQHREDELSEFGKGEIKDLILQLENFIDQPVICTSPRLRAIHSAHFFEVRYNTTFKPIEELNVDTWNNKQKAIIIGGIKFYQDQRVNLIIVSHEPVILDILRTITGKTKKETSTGSAFVIDQTTNKVLYVKGHARVEIK